MNSRIKKQKTKFKVYKLNERVFFFLLGGLKTWRHEFDDMKKLASNSHNQSKIETTV